MPDALSLGPSFQAVTFDVGGTLLTPHPSVGHIYAEVAARHGYKGVSPALLNRRFAAAWRRLKNFHYTRPHWAGLVDATFRGLIPVPPSRCFFPTLYERFAEPGAWRIYEDALPVLEALAARGVKLGIISNWDERLRPLLRALGLSKRFNVIVISCEVGAAKPAPAIFRRAAVKLRLDPETILHVGDSPAMDVRGSRAAGLRAVLLQRHGKARFPGQIRSLTELTDFPFIHNPYP